MKISDHISLAEATKSNTAIRLGINNTPTESVLKNMRVVANLVFEPLRKHFDHPIAISSFFRSIALNKALGGSKNSQHCKGEAMDIDADVLHAYGLTNKEVFEFIRDNLEFDQLIWEFKNDDGTPAWVHVSYRKGRNRKQVLISSRENGKVVYKTAA